MVHLLWEFLLLLIRDLLDEASDGERGLERTGVRGRSALAEIANGGPRHESNDHDTHDTETNDVAGTGLSGHFGASLDVAGRGAMIDGRHLCDSRSFQTEGS